MFSCLPAFLKEFVPKLEVSSQARVACLSVVNFILTEHELCFSGLPEKPPLYAFVLEKIKESNIVLPGHPSKPNNGDSSFEPEVNERHFQEELLGFLLVSKETLSDFNGASEEEKNTTSTFFSFLLQAFRVKEDAF